MNAIWGDVSAPSGVFYRERDDTPAPDQAWISEIKAGQHMKDVSQMLNEKTKRGLYLLASTSVITLGLVAAPVTVAFDLDKPILKVAQAKGGEGGEGGGEGGEGGDGGGEGGEGGDGGGEGGEGGDGAEAGEAGGDGAEAGEAGEADESGDDSTESSGTSG